MTKKIAFLFITIGDVNFPKIWDNYFKDNHDKYNIYIHPKYPEKVTWNKDKIIQNLQETSWGFIVKAYIELFKSALQDKDNYKFITISESCLPIQSFDQFYTNVIDDPRSWIKLMDISKYDFNVILKKSPKKFIHHYARFCLNRHHVKKILINKTKLDFFYNMHIGDEYFLSILYPLINFKDFDVTYDDWNYTHNLKKNIKNKIRKLYEEQENNIKINNTDKIKKLQDEFNYISGHPKTIINVEKDLNKILKCKSFFYRKFAPTSNIEKYWNQIIKYHNKNNKKI